MSIFNRRRRPRQAVYASPQNQDVTSTNFVKEEVPDEQLANMIQDFETGPMSYSSANSNQKSTSTYFDQPSNTANPRPLQNRNPSLYKHPNNNNNYNNTNYYSNRNTNQVKDEQPYAGGGLTNSCTYSSGQQARMPSQQNNWYNPSNPTNLQQNTPKREFKFKR